MLQTEIYVASIKDRATSMQIIRQAVEEKIPMYLWAMNYFSRKDENSAETKNVGNVNSALRFLRYGFVNYFKFFLRNISGIFPKYFEAN